MTEYNGVERSTTERLRQLLDERGVEWEALSDQQEGEFTITATRWHDGEGGLLTMCISEPHGSTWDFFWLPTPEQAVEATLGREPNDKEMLRLHDRLNVALLRLERNVGNGDERIAAIAEAHELLEDAATLGRGTCKYDFVPNIGNGFLDACGLKCSCCGREQMSMDAPKFCPDCGRRVEK